MQKNIASKIWEIIKKRKLLRTLSLLNAIFILFIIFFFSINLAYSKKIAANEKQVQQNEQDLQSLQKLVLNSGGAIDLEMFKDKSFADSDEVIPFIALLENMFSKADPQADIVVKSPDDQIFVNHYADYKVSLKISDKDALYSALDELYNSRFITKILDFSINYPDDPKTPGFSIFEFTVRLFLK